MRKTKAQLEKENEALFELAAIADAHRLCDRNPDLVFRDQLERSRLHVQAILKMLQR